ncbi:hypothetical protein [Xanthomonas sp. MUS 060]|uniref:hypothetical protein n=1 Tax=Xanthomonas sp. MUS 060 TaxID=1588031 RepID=UPI000A94E501|nr:hypothetical protein [Xanthomonas sp. MUS 060]
MPKTKNNRRHYPPDTDGTRTRRRITDGTDPAIVTQGMRTTILTIHTSPIPPLQPAHATRIENAQGIVSE